MHRKENIIEMYDKYYQFQNLA